MKGNYRVVSFAIILISLLIFLSITTTVHAATDIVSVNWSGYTFYRSDTEEVSKVVSYITIPSVRLPSYYEYGTFFGLSGWVGVSPEYNGSPILFQGGWLIHYDIYNPTFEEYLFYMLWSESGVISSQFIPVDLQPGYEISVTIEEISENVWRLTIGGPYGLYTFTETISDEMMYAHFIVEAPTIVFYGEEFLEWLLDFDDTYLPMTCVDDKYGTYYYNNGLYYHHYIYQEHNLGAAGTYVQKALSEFKPYPNGDDEVHVWYNDYLYGGGITPPPPPGGGIPT